MRSKAWPIALGGMLTAVAVVIMNMGSLIPLFTYVCPVLCILITRPLLDMCGRKISWCYYGAVSILALLMAPDREAAVVYVFLGYYPMIRHLFDRIPVRGLKLATKLAFFTTAGVAAYGLLLFVLGTQALMAEFQEMGMVLLIVMVVMWDVLFVLVDRLLVMPLRKRK